MNASDLRFMFKCGNVVMADSSYAMPTRAWLNGPYSEYFNKSLFALGISYAGQWDCDDFAALYRVLACRCHAKTGTRKEQGIAVGEYFYMRNDGQAHAINVSVTDAGVIYIEPQTQFELTLKGNELCPSFVRF